MRGVVCLSIFDWWCHSHGHSDFQLARALARRMPVMFVNSIGMRAPRPGSTTSPMRRIARKALSTARFVKFADKNSNLTIITPLSAPIYTGLAGQAITDFLTFQISLLCKTLNFCDPIVVVTLPTFANIALRLDGSKLFYYRSDRHADFEGANRELLISRESLLFEKADVVLYSNESLFDSERAALNGRALLIGHGIDTRLFSPDGPEAPELRGLPRPRVGFFGDLRSRSLDFDLIVRTARLCPTVQFVLGGPQLDDLGMLRRMTNVHILSSCPHERMPERWRALDVAILPYRRSAWQDASEPIKLNEIVATGLPAVGTPLPAFLRRPRDVDIADGPEAFAAALRRLLGAPKTRVAERATQAMTSWDAIADRLIMLSAGNADPPSDAPHHERRVSGS